MADAINSRNNNCNVLVGWYNADFPYFQALANIRLVGRVVAQALLYWVSVFESRRTFFSVFFMGHDLLYRFHIEIWNTGKAA